MILFQDNILKLIDSFTIDTLPHSILIKGDVGSGKHMIASYISEKFNLEYVNITNNINLDTINDIYLSNQLTAYVIEVDNLSIKEQNTILKLLEEPSITAFLLLLSSNNMILTTVENRCYKIKLNTYTKDQLSKFIFDNVDLILSIAKTPGQALDLQGEDIAGMYELANKIFQHIRTSNFSNVLSISNKFKFDEKTKNGFSVDNFSLVLLSVAQTLDPTVYSITNQYINDLNIPKVKKQQIFEQYLLNLKYKWTN